MTQIPDGRRRRNQMHDITGQRNNAAGSQDRRAGAGNRFDAGLLFLQRLSGLHVIVGEKNGIIHRRPQLDAADDDISQIHQGVPHQVGNRHIIKDRRFNRDHDDHRNHKGAEAGHNHQEHAQKGPEIHPCIIRRDRFLNILSGRRLAHQIAFLRIILSYDAFQLIGALERRIAFFLCSYVNQHTAEVLRMEFAGQGLGKEFLRDPLGKRIGHGRNAFYIGKPFDLFRHFPFRGRRSVGIYRH